MLTEKTDKYVQLDSDLSAFSPGKFDKGAGILKQTLWYFVNALLVRASWNPFMGIKIVLLKM